MHQLETLIQAIPPAVFAAGGSGAAAFSQSFSPDSIASPLASFASANHTFPAGVPPPSLHVFPLTNPSTHFTAAPPVSSPRTQSPNTAFRSMLGQSSHNHNTPGSEQQEDTPRMFVSASYLYFDDEGYTRWQGETSGLPLLSLLVENHTPVKSETEKNSPDPSWTDPSANDSTTWFPNRTPRRTDVNPETLWRLITSYIVPELMDRYIFYIFLLFCICADYLALLAWFNAICVRLITFCPSYMFQHFWRCVEFTWYASCVHIAYSGLRKSQKVGRTRFCSVYCSYMLPCITSHRRSPGTVGS